MVSIEVNAASDKGDQEGCGDEPIYSSRDKDLNETRVSRTKRRAEHHSGTRSMPRSQGRRAYEPFRGCCARSARVVLTLVLLSEENELLVCSVPSHTICPSLIKLTVCALE